MGHQFVRPPEVQLADTLISATTAIGTFCLFCPPAGSGVAPKSRQTGVSANENGVLTLRHHQRPRVADDSLVIVVSDLASLHCHASYRSLFGCTLLAHYRRRRRVERSGNFKQWEHPADRTWGGHVLPHHRCGIVFAQDSVDITFLETPFVDLPVDTVLCAGNPIELDIDPSVIEAQNIISGVGFGCAGLSGSFPSYTYAPGEHSDFSLVVQNDKGASRGQHDVMCHACAKLPVLLW